MTLKTLRLQFRFLLPLIGAGKAELGGKLMSGAAAMRRAGIKLVPLGPQSATVTMVSLDPWRTAVSLGQLSPGTHRWQMQFERAANVNNK